MNGNEFVTEWVPCSHSGEYIDDPKLEKDGTAVIDFSKEMKNYAKEEERQIVESIAWTLTQFKEIKQVQFQINGEKLAKMPVGGTPLGEG